MVNPLDMQQVITQTHISERVQQVQQHSADVQQRHFAMQFDEERKKLKEKVRETEDRDKVIISDEKERNASQDGRSAKNDGGAASPSEEADSAAVSNDAEAAESPRHIDIKV